jgi:excisionase family DNA binding protein
MTDDAQDEPAPPPRSWRPERGRRSLTASEAAALIGVSVATVRGWADDGRLPAYRTEGGHRRFELDELRAWLTRRGAAAPETRRFTRAPQEVPACPALARELNARTQAIVDRALAGYHEGVPTPFPRPSAPALTRVAVRFVRVVTTGLETGRPALSSGQAELAGLRGGLEGDAGVRVLVEHTRIAMALHAEAEAAEREGAAVEPYGIPALLAVIDHAQAAVARGFQQAQGVRARGRAGRPDPRREA